VYSCLFSSFKKLFIPSPAVHLRRDTHLLLIAVLASGRSPTSLGSKWVYAELGSTEWFSAPWRISFYEAFKKQLWFFPCAATFITRQVYCTYSSKSM